MYAVHSGSSQAGKPVEETCWIEESILDHCSNEPKTQRSKLSEIALDSAGIPWLGILPFL